MWLEVLAIWCCIVTDFRGLPPLHWPIFALHCSTESPILQLFVLHNYRPNKFCIARRCVGWFVVLRWCLYWRCWCAKVPNIRFFNLIDTTHSTQEHKLLNVINSQNIHSSHSVYHLINFYRCNSLYSQLLYALISNENCNEYLELDSKQFPDT
jgi:hypothetical protein